MKFENKRIKSRKWRQIFEKIFFYYKKSIDKSYKIKDYNFYSIATIHLINRYITKNKINEAEIELKSYLDLVK